jgi:hypothetical protein
MRISHATLANEQLAVGGSGPQEYFNAENLRKSI